jgi:preprotein translocase SecE subunit
VAPVAREPWRVPRSSGRARTRTDELRKVVRPTRNELITYTSVVLVFVLAVMLYVSLLDFGLGRLVLWAFGGGSS